MVEEEGGSCVGEVLKLESELKLRSGLEIEFEVVERGVEGEGRSGRTQARSRGPTPTQPQT